MSQPVPPIAATVPHRVTLHGDTREDPYHWLRNKESAQVIAHLEQENAYAEALMAPHKALEDEIFTEIVGRIKQTDLSVPSKDGDYFYYSRTEEGLQYPIYARKHQTLDAPEQVVLDLNEISKAYEFCAIGALSVSDDGRLLAYSLDTTGFRDYTLSVIDIESRRVLLEGAARVGSVVWTRDNETLLYTVKDDAKRAYRLYRRRLGEDSGPELLFQEDDERFRVAVQRSRSKDYMFLISGSHTATEVRFAKSQPTAEFELVCERRDNIEYYLAHRGAEFFILVNDEGRNFRVARTDIASPGRESWRAFIAHSQTVMLESFRVFQDHYVLCERESGLPHLRVGNFSTTESHRIAMPEEVYAASADSNPEFATKTFRFRYESPITPSSVYDYDTVTRERRLLKQTEVVGDFDSARYETRRVFATADDGAQIPISLVYKKDTVAGGPAPMWLTGYGSYGMAYPVTFSHARLSLLDRGLVVGIAHIRGGGEMGKSWHDQGRMFNKTNSFGDFIECAKHLVEDRITDADRLVIEGASAGGLLMGAVANRRPDLFAGIVCKVPFLDVLNTMLDDTLPLTVGEYEEWGNPNIVEQYNYIKSYCPYTNIRAQDYPAMLVTTSLNDSQVMYWEPAKYVARLRANKTDSRPLLFKTVMAGGHGGPSGRYDKYREVAYDYAFALSILQAPDR